MVEVIVEVMLEFIMEVIVEVILEVIVKVMVIMENKWKYPPFRLTPAWNAALNVGFVVQ